MIKMKHEESKQTATVRDEVQAAAFLKAGYVPATKADAEKLYGEEITTDENIEEE